MTAPPRWITRWLERRLAPDERDEMLGDLDEQFRLRCQQTRRWAARVWYLRQAAALGWGFYIRRRDIVSTRHERTRGRWALDNFITDWRFAWRGLRHSPAFAGVAVLTLTCAIGLSTAVFSLVNGILLKPLDLPNADRLVRLGQTRPASMGTGVVTAAIGEALPQLALDDVTIGQWTAHTKVLAAVVPYSVSGNNVTTSAGTEQLRGAEIGGRFFEAIPITPLRGRLIHANDDRPDAAPVVVISERFWTQSLGGRDDVLGRSVTIETTAYTVVGVIPASFTFPENGVDFFLPGHWTWPQPGGRRMFSISMDTLGLMRPGTTIAEVRAEGERVLRTIATADPAFFEGTVAVPRLHANLLQADIVADVRPALVALMAGMTIVLLAACINLANLLLARNTARTREVALRLALGASRVRLARPLFFEQVIIAVTGGVAGGALAWWTLRALPHIAPADLPRLADVSFNLASLGFATLAAFVTATIVGLWPAWRVPDGRLRDLASPNRIAALRSTRSADAMRTVLVFGQVALAVVLLVGAALIGRSLVALFRVNPGYQPDHVLTFQVSTPADSHRARGRLTTLYTALLDRLHASSNVVAAGVASVLPLHNGISNGTFGIDGRPAPPDPADRPRARWQIVTPAFLAAMGTGVVRGRGFADTDNATGEQVVLVNQLLADRYFPGEDAIGRRVIAIGRTPRRIVGIVETVKLGALSDTADPILYYATAQVGEILAYSRISGGVAVRVKGDPEAMIATIRAYVREIDGGSPVFNAVPLRDRLNRTFAQPRFYAIVLALFAALALTTAVLGIYGVLAYSVERRRMEFGVRRALGADERHIVGLVLRRALSIAAAGIGVGLVVAASGAGLLRSLLFGVRPVDPLTFAAVAIAVLVIVAIAAWQPAVRALRIDPAVALRQD